jgi:hypothetical protein
MVYPYWDIRGYQDYHLRLSSAITGICDEPRISSAAVMVRGESRSTSVVTGISKTMQNVFCCQDIFFWGGRGRNFFC